MARSPLPGIGNGGLRGTGLAAEQMSGPPELRCGQPGSLGPSSGTNCPDSSGCSPSLLFGDRAVIGPSPTRPLAPLAPWPARPLLMEVMLSDQREALLLLQGPPILRLHLKTRGWSCCSLTTLGDLGERGREAWCQRVQGQGTTLG